MYAVCVCVCSVCDTCVCVWCLRVACVTSVVYVFSEWLCVWYVGVSVVCACVVSECMWSVFCILYDVYVCIVPVVSLFGVCI